MHSHMESAQSNTFEIGSLAPEGVVSYVIQLISLLFPGDGVAVYVFLARVNHGPPGLT